MTSTKGSGLMAAAWQAYRRHFGSLMGAMAVIGCVSAMAFVPLLFMAVPETAFLCWLCPVMYVLLVLPLRGNAACCLQDALADQCPLSPKLISLAGYGRKLLRGVIALLWAVPMMLALIAGYFSFAGDLDAMTLYAMIVKLGGGDDFTGVKMVALFYLLMLLLICAGLFFHCMTRHSAAAGAHLTMKLRLKGMGIHLLSLTLFVPFGVAAFFPVSAYVRDIMAAVDAFLSDFVLAVPDPVPCLIMVAGAALVLLMPVIPLRNLLLAALSRQAANREESAP